MVDPPTENAAAKFIMVFFSIIAFKTSSSDAESSPFGTWIQAIRLKVLEAKMTVDQSLRPSEYLSCALLVRKETENEMRRDKIERRVIGS